jgi:GNAT superfamily N-acetyltransferase
VNYHTLTTRAAIDAYGPRLRELTLRNGLMWPTVQDFLDRNWRLSRVVVAQNDLGRIVGWAFIFQHQRGSSWNLHVFVDPAFRRRGIGRRLISHARIGRKAPLAVFGHNQVARRAFAPFIDSGRAYDAW